MSYIERLKSVGKSLGNGIIALFSFLLVTFIMSILLLKISNIIGFTIPDDPIDRTYRMGYIGLLFSMILTYIITEIYFRTKLMQVISSYIWERVDNDPEFTGLRAKENEDMRECYENMFFLNFSFSVIAFIGLISILVYYLGPAIKPIHIALSFLLVGAGVKSLESGLMQLGADSNYRSRIRNETLSVITSQIESIFIIFSIITQFTATFNLSLDKRIDYLGAIGFWSIMSVLVISISIFIYNRVKI